MTEASQPGPSAQPADIEHDEQLQEAETQFQQGIQAIKTDDLDRAVELFGLVLQTRCQKFGDVDIKCASTYFRYGAALFYKAHDEQDVFGAPLQAAAADTAEAAEAEDDESEDEKENVDDKGKKPMREEDLPQAATSAQDEEADESAVDRTDMELAWENLEVAKYIYEHHVGDAHAQELADIHSLLADIGMEQENFESALQDHKRALQLLDGILKADDRCLAELHYKASLTLQYLDQPEEALKEIKTAVKLLETRIDSVKAATDPSASALAPAAAAAAAVSQQPAAAHDSQHSTPAVSTSTGAAQPSPVALEAPTGPATASTSAAAVHSGSAVPEASVDRSAHQTSTSAPHSAPQALSDAPCAQTESTATPGASDASATGTTAEVAASSDAAVPDPTGVEGTRGFAGESIAGLQAEAAQKELADLESVLEDMYEKVEELQQIVKEQISTKNALKAAFSQIAASLGGPSAGRGLGAGPSTAPAAPVVDLGVVGRGTKRVTPMPFPAASTSGSTAAQASKPAAQKRSFEDLMNGGSVPGSSSSDAAGATTFGFGQGPSLTAAFAPAKSAWPQPALDPKKRKTELVEKDLNGDAKQQHANISTAASAQLGKTAEKRPLPVFLQAAKVAETYGNSPASKQVQQ